MLKKLFTLLKLARKLALSDALIIVSKIHKPPIIIKVFLGVFSISIFGKQNENLNLSNEERLCNSVQGMGTTFIKLGQFLSTRPDIIGVELSKQFEKLQYKHPHLSNFKDKETVKQQIKNWSLNTAENLIYKTNELELLIKKNSNNSINILSDFIINQPNRISN